MSANALDSHLVNIVNNDISLNKYSKHAKTTTVRPIFKRDDRIKAKNHLPVSLLKKFFFENMRTISAWKSYKFHRYISFKIHFCLLQVPIVQITY